MEESETSLRTWWYSHERSLLVTLATVAALALIWFGWQVAIVQHRRAMRARIEAGGDVMWGYYVEPRPSEVVNIRSTGFDHNIPIVRHLLGDEAANPILFYRRLTAKVRRSLNSVNES